ncbi:hypothetical protein H0H81_007077 [Sphagnurus paluster]|uniref:Uncharacterized protein n=1 Tax=Sphagnurus paluster TaxID=117069 RepID=A0A9P7KIQ6_9AGAR|nr:hypothetical protein H0H81_007077 [Sphagnurus paluster]
MWLERSGTCPLTLKIDEPPFARHIGFDAEDERRARQHAVQIEVASLLVSQAHRWKSIDFQFTLTFPHVLAKLSPGSLSILESVKLEGPRNRSGLYNEKSFVSRDNFWAVINACPSLRKGQWEAEYCWHQYRHHRLQDVRWGQLTSVDVAMPAILLFEILPFCTTLTELCYTEPQGSWAKDLSPCFPRLENPITLPHLRKISLTPTMSTDVIFEYITAPSLASVFFDQSRTVETCNPSPSTFNAFLTRSNCRLQQYSYKYLPQDERGQDTLLEILDLPSMAFAVDLAIHGSRETMPRLIPFLARTSETLQRLPNIKKITIRGIYIPQVALSKMVLSRRSSQDHNLALLEELSLSHQTFNALDLDGLDIGE